MDFIFEKKKVHVLLTIIAIISLSITAQKCRQMVGEDSASKSGQFTFLNCFDMSSGTLACSVKEGVKFYFYNIRSIHVERARNLAIETSLTDALTQGMSAKEASKQAQLEGKKAAKLATRQAKRIIGPIVSSGWDFFEAIYYGGTITEGFLRGSGTLVGAYTVGFLGEQRLGRVGYLFGSQLGSWVGGRIGLMVYDVVNGIHFMISAAETVKEVMSSEDNSEYAGSSFEDSISDGYELPEHSEYETMAPNEESKYMLEEDLGVQEHSEYETMAPNEEL